MAYHTKSFCKNSINKGVGRLEDAVTTLDRYLTRKEKINIFYEDHDIKGSIYVGDINTVVKEAKKLVEDEIENLQSVSFVGDK